MSAPEIPAEVSALVASVMRDGCTPVRRPKLLDLFAGEGGAAYGYMLAGFDVTAVDDIERPARAPGITWVTADATTYPLDGFDAVTGSPPCTDKTTRRTLAEHVRGGDSGTGWMLGHTIDRFRESGLPYVVENVSGARDEMDGSLVLCGTMFGLHDGPWLLERHRLFLSNVLLMAPGPHRCKGGLRAGRSAISVYGDLRINDRACGGRLRPGGDMRAGVERARRLMEMPWASATGLPLAIPPAYTRFIGEQLLTQLPGYVAPSAEIGGA